jgi:hypothetical protein
MTIHSDEKKLIGVEPRQRAGIARAPTIQVK